MQWLAKTKNAAPVRKRLATIPRPAHQQAMLTTSGTTTIRLRHFTTMAMDSLAG